MKNFKFKFNYLLNLFKKNKLLKKTNIFLENIIKLIKLDNFKNKLLKKINIFLENVIKLIKLENSKKILIEKYQKFYTKTFKVNYLLFFLSIIFFYYLIYLSFPGILHGKADQNYFTKLLKEQYDLEFSLTPEIRYSILPKPHFQINDVIIFNRQDDFQKEVAQVKKLKIFLKQKNFLKKKELKIKSVELFETNFFITKLDIKFIKNFLNKGFDKKSLIVKRANLFFQDQDKNTISFLNLKKINMYYNEQLSQDILISNGEIFNMPFDIIWKQDQNKLEKNTNLKFKKIKLNILNFEKITNNKKENRLQFYLNRSRYLINYNLSDEKIIFDSNNSFIGNDKINFSGKVFLDPFNFDINSSLDSLSIIKLLKNNMFLKEILSSEFFLNENFNGIIKLNVEKLENNPLFDSLKINANFVGQTINFSNSVFLNKKIANLILEKGTLYEEQNNLIFKGELEFKINDLNKLFNKFVVPKKNRNNFDKIKFDIMMNLTNSDFRILKIVNYSFKDKEFQDIDNLIYEFNSGGIKITNWIEFKIFANKLISFYSG